MNRRQLIKTAAITAGTGGLFAAIQTKEKRLHTSWPYRNMLIEAAGILQSERDGKIYLNGYFAEGSKWITVYTYPDFLVQVSVSSAHKRLGELIVDGEMPWVTRG